MVLIYSHIGSSRLRYICSFIFKEQLRLDFEVTIDSESFKNHIGPRINYSDSKIDADEFFIQNHSLLFENEKKQQDVTCFMVNGKKAFFKTANCDFPFDIFAASFYLLSRYEEYLPHEKDVYGRFAHENSLAFKECFLNLPLINFWLQDFAESLKNKFLPGSLVTTLNFPTGSFGQPSTFNFLPTYDIDIAYSYKHKGLLRNAGGFFKSPSVERIKVLTGAAPDPFDCYDFLKELHNQYQLHPIYFFLVAEKNSMYDKNILPHKDAMWKLVRNHAKKYTVCLHPSWQSGDDRSLLKKEKQQLEEMGEKPVSKSRQHYIRFNLPEGYQRLITAGLTDDYSMGYGSINGFRASVAASFFWYDLEKEVQTTLRIHPFCFMDANSFYEQRQNTDDTFKELMHYLSVCKTVNGTFITIWHNNFLGTAPAFEEWRALYQKFIAQVRQ
jgi:hypothetical protein